MRVLLLGTANPAEGPEGSVGLNPLSGHFGLEIGPRGMVHEMTRKELKDIIAKGEGQSLDLTSEFSKRVRDDLHSRLAALANTEGGHLIFGVDSNKKVVGCRLGDNERAQVSQHAKSCKPVIRFDMMDVEVDGLEVTVVYVPKSPILHADKEFRFPQRVGDTYGFMEINGIIAALRERGFAMGERAATGFVDLFGSPFAGKKDRAALEAEEVEGLQQLLNSCFPDARTRGLSQLERVAYTKKVEDWPQILELLERTVGEDSVEARRRAVRVFYVILANADPETKQRLVQKYLQAFLSSLDVRAPVEVRHEAIRLAELIPDQGIVRRLLLVLHNEAEEDYRRSGPHPVFLSLKAMGEMRREILAELSRQASMTVDDNARHRLLACIEYLEQY